jgi:plastocyanin
MQPKISQDGLNVTNRLTHLGALVLTGALFAATACGGKSGSAPPVTNATPSTQLQIRARSLKFDSKTLVAAAKSDITVRFENDDDGILHNLAVYRDKSTKERIFAGELVNGTKTVEYHFEVPLEGDYYFRCDTHPDMNGAFLVR